MPAGADAVVRVEDTRRADGDGRAAGRASSRGRDVRHAGDDVRAGDVVLAPGVRLGPAELGVLASVGRATRRSSGRARASRVVTTGDELIGVGRAAARRARVRNSGAYVIPALVERAGGETVSVAHARDDPALDPRDDRAPRSTRRRRR